MACNADPLKFNSGIMMLQNIQEKCLKCNDLFYMKGYNKKAVTGNLQRPGAYPLTYPPSQIYFTVSHKGKRFNSITGDGASRFPGVRWKLFTWNI